MNERRPKVHFIPQLPSGEPPAASQAAASTPILARDTLHGVLRHVHAEEQMRPGDGEVFLPQSVYQKIMEHLSSDTGRELGGLLVGTEILGPEGRPAILIRDALPARHTKSNQTRLTFPEESWVEFNRELDRRRDEGIELQRVGWYHSHPKMGIFLSHWDLDVCLEFRRATQVALVVDPVEPKGGFFIQGTEGFRTVMPQGFWEVKDLSPSSVVRWRGLSPSPELPPSFLSWLTPKPAAVPEEPEEERALAAPPEMAPPAIAPPSPPLLPVQPVTPSPSHGPSIPADSPPGPRDTGMELLGRRGIAVLAALLAASLMALGWSIWSVGKDAEERSAAAVRKQEEDIARLSGEMGALKTELAELNQRMSRAVVPPSSKPQGTHEVAAPSEPAAATPPKPSHPAPGKSSRTQPKTTPPSKPATKISQETPAAQPPKAAEPAPQAKTSQGENQLPAPPQKPPTGTSTATPSPPPAQTTAPEKPPESRDEMPCWP